MKIIDRLGKLTNINFKFIKRKKSLQKYMERKNLLAKVFKFFYWSSVPSFKSFENKFQFQVRKKIPN